MDKLTYNYTKSFTCNPKMLKITCTCIYMYVCYVLTSTVCITHSERERKLPGKHTYVYNYFRKAAGKHAYVYFRCNPKMLKSVPQKIVCMFVTS